MLAAQVTAVERIPGPSDHAGAHAATAHSCANGRHRGCGSGHAGEINPLAELVSNLWATISEYETGSEDRGRAQ